LTKDGGLAVGTDTGIFYHYPYLTGWDVLGRNLPTTTALELRTGPSGVRLYATTHGRSRWSFDPSGFSGSRWFWRARRS
jgi:hypothetical protein